MAGDAYTISVSSDNHAEEHSRRSYTPNSAERSLRDRNEVIYDCGDDRQHFNDFFRESIDEYNARQTREERKKSYDYCGDLEQGGGYGRGKHAEQPFVHFVAQIGNRDKNGVTDESFDADNWKKLKADGKYSEAASYVKSHLRDTQETQDFREILIQFGKTLRDQSGKPGSRFSNFLVHGIILHADEPNGTIHLDVRGTFFTDEGDKVRKDGKRNGLSMRVSQNKALAKMGFRTTKEKTALAQFYEALKDDLEIMMIERGYQRDVKGEHRAHQPTAVYAMRKEAEKAERRLGGLQDSLHEAKRIIMTGNERSMQLDRRERELDEATEQLSRDREQYRSAKKKADAEAEAAKRAAEEAEAKRKDADAASEKYNEAIAAADAERQAGERARKQMLDDAAEEMKSLSEAYGKAFAPRAIFGSAFGVLLNMSNSGYQVGDGLMQSMKRIIDSGDEQRMAMLTKPVADKTAAYSAHLRRSGDAIRSRLESLADELMPDEEHDALNRTIVTKE